MKVEIWSDVMCPFCYIGKRRFERALEQFDKKQEVEVEWKSFQLNPDMKTEPGKSVIQYLAETKGWSMQQAREANERVTDMAKQEGLTYHMDRAVVANSFDAHRLLQLAKKHTLGDQMEEHLFRAYFTEGLNIADHEVLIKIGSAAGLQEEDMRAVLKSDTYAREVDEEQNDAARLGVRGVPFFVIDRKYGVSGAQAVETFIEALEKAAIS
jgi:predicted DsbA family dithiol-disulfide isomerase